jgi:hypothetical protein
VAAEPIWEMSVQDVYQQHEITIRTGGMEMAHPSARTRNRTPSAMRGLWARLARGTVLLHALILLRHVSSRAQQTRASRARRSPTQAVGQQALSRECGRVVLEPCRKLDHDMTCRSKRAAVMNSAACEVGLRREEVGVRPGVRRGSGVKSRRTHSRRAAGGPTEPTRREVPPTSCRAG